MLASWNGLTVIAVPLGLFLSAAILSLVWSRLSLAGVSCQRTLSEHRVFPDEPVELKLRLVNKKLLPLPWVDVEDEVPSGVTGDASISSGSRPGYGILRKSASLLWYAGVTWRQTLKCARRGYYGLGPITVSSGDIFGFYPRSFTLPTIDHIIVYPRVFPIAQLDIPSLDLSGDSRSDRRILQDPTRVIGARDYTPHDSPRHIHWKATARHQNLQVKVFEPTTALKCALFLGIDTFEESGGYNEDDLELGISLAASIANFLTEKRSPVGLFVNSRLADSGQAGRLLPSSGTNQLVSILEILAKVTPVTENNFIEFTRRELKSLLWGTTMIFIVSKPTPTLLELASDLKASGHRLMIFKADQNTVGNIDLSRVYNIEESEGLLVK